MYLACMKNKFTIVGTIGALFAALCCFTPFLPILLPAIGLGGLMGYIYNDAVLLPTLAIFLAIAGYGFWKSKVA